MGCFCGAIQTFLTEARLSDGSKDVGFQVFELQNKKQFWFWEMVPESVVKVSHQKQLVHKPATPEKARIAHCLLVALMEVCS